MSAPDIATVQVLRSDLALQIARELGRRGLSQVAAALWLDIPQPTLSKIVNGRVDQLSLELLIRIAVRAGLSVVMHATPTPEEAGVYRFQSHGEPVAERQKSALAESTRVASTVAARKLTAEQRLDAMCELTRLVSQLQASGKQAARARARKAGSMR